MTKLLRKYNKWLLGIGGSLLMVTFLLTGPQSIFQPDPNKRIVATMAGATVRQKDVAMADRELEGLKAFAPELVRSMQIDSGAHWMLLTKEATDAGLVGAEGDGTAWIKDLAEDRRTMYARAEVVREARERYPQFADQLLRSQQFFSQMLQSKLRDPQLPTVEQIEDIMRSGPSAQGIVSMNAAATQGRLSLPQFELALARLHGVFRMQQAYMNAARTSDRRAVADVKRSFDRVLVDAVVIPASKATDGVPEPTEAQIDEQYLKYKSVKPGTGEYGFGYLQPPSVKFEWMMLDRAAIGNAISIDPVEANKFWLQNKDKYKGEYSADKARVEADLKNAKIDQIMMDADRFYKTHLRGFTRSLTQDGPIKKLSDDWEQKRPKMADLAAELDKSLKAQNPQLPSPTVDGRTTEWVKIGLVSNVPGIGSSRIKMGTKQGTIGDLLGDLYELNPTSTVGLQEKVPFENALTDGKGNVYYINVLAYRSEAPPDSIEEVKTEVIKDLKLREAFEKLEQDGASLQVVAVRDGLDAVAKLYSTPAAPGAADQTPTPLPVQKLANVKRDVADGALDAQPVRDAVMNTADALGQLFKATPENVVQRTLTVPIPGALSLVVVQIEGQAPVTMEDLRTASKGYFDQAAQNELVKVSMGAPPFSFAAMKERYDYKPVAADEGKNSGTSAGTQPSQPVSDLP